MCAATGVRGHSHSVCEQHKTLIQSGGKQQTVTGRIKSSKQMEHVKSSSRLFNIRSVALVPPSDFEPPSVVLAEFTLSFLRVPLPPTPAPTSRSSNSCPSVFFRAPPFGEACSPCSLTWAPFASSPTRRLAPFFAFRCTHQHARRRHGYANNVYTHFQMLLDGRRQTHALPSTRKSTCAHLMQNICSQSP
jgi:hypothetical protein